MAIAFFFFFGATATTEIYTLSLHDALPIFRRIPSPPRRSSRVQRHLAGRRCRAGGRSREHTSELQSQSNLVCRLPPEKKKKLPRCLTCEQQTNTCWRTCSAHP